MTVRAPHLTDRQHDVQTRVIEAIAGEHFDALRDELVVVAREVWIPPATLVVAAALIQVIVERRTGPWGLDESMWETFLPERLLAGRSERRNASFALQAAGCLAGGVWLDVGCQESFWHLPLWPYTVDLVELLTRVVRQEASVSSEVLAEQVQAMLSPSLSS